jgi:hypothetical protein
MGDQWPPSEGLSTIVVSRSDSVFTSAASTHIKAPAEQVFNAVRAVDDYPKWNSFVPRVTIHSQPSGIASDSALLERGTSFTYHVVMDSSKPDSVHDTKLLVSDVSTPASPSTYVPAERLADDTSFTADLQTVYRISWVQDYGGLMGRGLRMERFHEIIVRGDGECEVRTWELMGGLLAHTVAWMYKDVLHQKFKDWVADLKKFCEEPGKSS